MIKRRITATVSEYINPETVMSMTLCGSMFLLLKQNMHSESLTDFKRRFFLDMVLAVFLNFQEGALSF